MFGNPALIESSYLVQASTIFLPLFIGDRN